MAASLSRLDQATPFAVLIAQLPTSDLELLAERLRPFMVVDGDDDGEALITTAQAAERLRVHPRSLLRAAREDRVPGARRVGRGWRFSPDRLEIQAVGARAEPASASRPRAARRSRRRTSSTTAAILGRSD